MIGVLRILGPLLLTGVAFVLALSVVETERVLAALGGVSWTALAVALALVVANLLLACLRYHLLLGDLGIAQSFGRSYRSNVYSVVGGMMLFNFFGQTMTRSAFLRRVDGAPAIALVVTAIERAVGLALLLALALAGALAIFGGVGIESEVGVRLLVIAANLILVAGVASWFGMRRLHRRFLRSLVLDDLARPVLRAGAVTVAMHATMLGAYVVLAVAAAPAAGPVDLLAVSAIVMFAAALPISFAGWGVREFTAAQAFGAIGLASEAGLAVAVLIGLLSLVSLTANAAAALAVGSGVSDPTMAPGAREKRRASPLVRLLSWGLPAATAALVVFNVPVPTGSGAVNVNLADPPALVGAFALVGLTLGGVAWHRLWRMPGLNLALALATAVVALGFLHGWAGFGVTHWALYNRLLGWGILLCFLLAGALAVGAAGRPGGALLFRVFVAAVCAIIAGEAALRLADRFLALEFVVWVSPRFFGMIGNPNALSFQAVLALAVALPARRMWVGRFAGPLDVAFLGLLGAGIWFSASRAGFAAAAVLAVVYLALGVTTWRRCLRAVGASASIVVVWTAAMTIEFAGWGPGQAPTLMGNPDYMLAVQADRLASIVGGLRMWRDNLFFGAGLGAFMQQQLATTGVPLVIHNSLIWLGAEFGLAGLLAILTIPAVILRSLLRDTSWRTERTWAVALGCLLTVGVFSLAHDMAYQRAFWLLLGAAIATPRRLAT